MESERIKRVILSVARFLGITPRDVNHAIECEITGCGPFTEGRELTQAEKDFDKDCLLLVGHDTKFSALRRLHALAPLGGKTRQFIRHHIAERAKQQATRRSARPSIVTYAGQ